MVERLKFSPTRTRKFHQFSKPISIHMEDDLCAELQNLRSEVLVHKLMEKDADNYGPDETHHNLFVDNEHKEEEFQNAIRNQAVVSIPEIEDIEEEKYAKLYPIRYHGPAQMVDGFQNFSPYMEEIKYGTYPGLDDDCNENDYDLDSEDEKWIDDNRHDVKVTAFEFEAVVAQLNSLKIADPKESDLLSIKSNLSISRDEDLGKIFQYWVSKKAKSMYGSLKPPKVRIGSSPPNKWKQENAYVAFHTKYIEQVRRRSTVESNKVAYVRIVGFTKKIKNILTSLQHDLKEQTDKGVRKKIQILKNIEIIEKNYDNFENDEMPLLALECDVTLEPHSTSMSYESSYESPPQLNVEINPYPVLNGNKPTSQDKDPSILKTLRKSSRILTPVKLVDSETVLTPKSRRSGYATSNTTPVSFVPSKTSKSPVTPSSLRSIPVKSSTPSLRKSARIPTPVKLYDSTEFMKTPVKPSNLIPNLLTPVKSICSSEGKVKKSIGIQSPVKLFEYAELMTTPVKPSKQTIANRFHSTPHTTPVKPSTLSESLSPIKTLNFSNLVLTTPVKSSPSFASLQRSSRTPTPVKYFKSSEFEPTPVVINQSQNRKSTGVHTPIQLLESAERLRNKIPKNSPSARQSPVKLYYLSISTPANSSEIKSPVSISIQSPEKPSNFDMELAIPEKSNKSPLETLRNSPIISRISTRPEKPVNFEPPQIQFLENNPYQPSSTNFNTERPKGILATVNPWSMASYIRFLTRPMESFYSGSVLKNLNKVVNPLPRLSATVLKSSNPLDIHIPTKSSDCITSSVSSVHQNPIIDNPVPVPQLTPEKLTNLESTTTPLNSFKSASTQTPIKLKNSTPLLIPVRLSESPEICTPVKPFNFEAVQNAVKSLQYASKSTQSPVKLKNSTPFSTPVKSFSNSSVRKNVEVQFLGHFSPSSSPFKINEKQLKPNSPLTLTKVNPPLRTYGRPSLIASTKRFQQRLTQADTSQNRRSPVNSKQLSTTKKNHDSIRFPLKALMPRNSPQASPKESPCSGSPNFDKTRNRTNNGHMEGNSLFGYFFMEDNSDERPASFHKKPRIN